MAGKKKALRKAIVKLFALNANAKNLKPETNSDSLIYILLFNRQRVYVPIINFTDCIFGRLNYFEVILALYRTSCRANY